MNWRTSDNYFVQIRESGSVVVPSSSASVVIRSLTPATNYIFGVSVVTVSYGKGREVVAMRRTRVPVGSE